MNFEEEKILSHIFSFQRTSISHGAQRAQRLEQQLADLRFILIFFSILLTFSLLIMFSIFIFFSILNIYSSFSSFQHYPYFQHSPNISAFSLFSAFPSKLGPFSSFSTFLVFSSFSSYPSSSLLHNSHQFLSFIITFVHLDTFHFGSHLPQSHFRLTHFTNDFFSGKLVSAPPLKDF